MSGEKTEKATPKKLDDLRKKGMSARSMEAPAGLSLLAAAVVLPALVQRLATTLHADMVAALSAAGESDLRAATGLAGRLLQDAVAAVLPALALVLLATVLGSVLVTREKPNLAMLKPSKQKMSPKARLKQLVSVHTVVELIRASAKLSLLGVVAYGSWKVGYEELTSGTGTVAHLLHTTGDAIGSLVLRVAALAVLVGVIDAWWVTKRFGKQARMSKQDLKDEHKQSEGSPEAKAAIRSAQHKLSRNRMIQAIPAADVVLANPTHLVVALVYDAESGAPVVVAKGAGAVADRIKEVAREHDVPVIADKPLARAIYKGCEIGDSIPVELYRAVAEVLAAVYAARRKSGLGPRNTSGGAAPRQSASGTSRRTTTRTARRAA